MTRRLLWLAVAIGCAADQPNARSDGAAAEPPTRPPPSETQFASVDVGAAFACGLTTEGKAYCWGLNEQGQLGDGTPQRRMSAEPVPVAGNHALRMVSAGREHACALTTDGRAFCWGYDPEGALGVAEEMARVPTPVATPLRFRHISAGDQRTCAVDTDGMVHCWGRFSRRSDNPAGSGGPEAAPVEAPARFRSVEAGLSHACGVSESAQVYCWGSNRGGAAGVETGVGTARWVPPQRVDLGDSVASLSVSSNATCAVTAGGSAYCWGRNGFGQLGNGAWTERDAPNWKPTRVVGGHRWRQVATAGGYACGLTVEGAAYCWGANPLPWRALGTAVAPDRCDTLRMPGGVECATRPVPVTGDLRFRSLAAGTCAIGEDGRTYCWGANEFGQLGNGSTDPTTAPVAVSVVARP